MPVSNHWLDDSRRIIEQRYVGDWRWEDVTPAGDEAHAMAASVAHNLVMICDMSQSAALPKGNVLSPARSNMLQVPANITHVIFVIQSRLIEVFAGLLFDMLPGWRKRAEIVKTLDEARQLASEMVAKMESSETSS